MILSVLFVLGKASEHIQDLADVKLGGGYFFSL